MELRQLKTFQTVATLLSFNRAALKLHYAQSSISAQIQVLEEELGVRLFDRLGRSIIVTEAGERLLKYAEKILDLADQTYTDIADSRAPQGSLTIRVPESFGVHRLPLIIKQFHTRFPMVKLRFITCANEGLAKDLRKGVTDLAILFAESVDSADLGVEVLGYESVIIVAHPGHPLGSRPVVKTAELENESFFYSRVDCSYLKSFQKILEQEKVRPKKYLEFNSIEAIKRSVMVGAGISVLPEIAVSEEISEGKLIALPWEEGSLEVASLMIWYKDRWLSPTLKAFMAATRDIFKGLDGGTKK